MEHARWCHAYRAVKREPLERRTSLGPISRRSSGGVDSLRPTPRFNRVNSLNSGNLGATPRRDSLQSGGAGAAGARSEVQMSELPANLQQETVPEHSK
jgi:hypothetical protein